MQRVLTTFLYSVTVGLVLAGSVVQASDWTHWRGPKHTGESPETDLISNWSLDGDNLIWRRDFIGRSTPILMNGKVYVVGRTGEGTTMQRVVACYDAKDGKLIWEEKSNVFHTTVPFTRVGWSSLTGDPETGNVYYFGVDGMFICYNEDGKRLWEHSFVEEYNRFSGYGGRTCTPVVDGDLVIVNGANNTWGDLLIMRHRFFAYDKRTGELVWISTINEPNKNTNYSVPVVAVVNGQRLLITGGGSGWIYAMKVGTGEQVWKFQLSKGAIQSSVVVDGNFVYGTHHVENLDNTVWGRVVSIDATGKGDVTKTHEVWRHDGLEVGYASPVIHDGRLYMVNNSGNLIALDAKTGEKKWLLNIGKVGKGSPVWADGKIYATEVNGSFHIIEPGESSARSLDSKQLPFNDKRFAEIFGSPAIAYGRVYFTSEVGLFCLGDKNSEFEVTSPGSVEPIEMASSSNGQPAHLQIIPAEIWASANDKIDFKVRAHDAMGRLVGEKKAEFSLSGIQGMINNGEFKPDKSAGNQAGYVVAKYGELEAKARVQVATDLPWMIDFENFALDKNPPLWPGTWKFFVKDLDGNKVLLKPPSQRNLKRHNLMLGPPSMSDYTIQADMKGVKVKRRSPDMGLIANRYYLDFMTKKKKLQIRTWPAELRRLRVEVPFNWTPDAWYTMKFRVDIEGGKAILKGKVWLRDQNEPSDWTITAEDPLPNTHGSPALYGDSVTNIYFDNVKITANK
ncbi:PQQ-like beta-propeller repeat protein [bacterium]|nr:PQQ-like beta-propeller repeat protein [bacterium]